jgi:enamine deaminase RidA (YjgF/YER057c/UK114 family)
MNIEARLEALGVVLPEPPREGGNYVSAKSVGQLCFLAGVISTSKDGVIAGVVGGERTVEDGYAAARACALTQLAVLRAALGSLDRVEQIVSVNGYVNAVPGFAESPMVINGFSDLMLEVFGEAGKHVRAAVGVSALPRNALVEVQMTVAVKPQ